MKISRSLSGSVLTDKPSSLFTLVEREGPCWVFFKVRLHYHTLCWVTSTYIYLLISICIWLTNSFITISLRIHFIVFTIVCFKVYLRSSTLLIDRKKLDFFIRFHLLINFVTFQVSFPVGLCCASLFRISSRFSMLHRRF